MEEKKINELNKEKSPKKEVEFKVRKNFKRQRFDSGFQEEVIKTSRISKTTGGGKRFRFNAVVVVGDGKGRVGFATGKAKEIPDAIKKAIRAAINSTITISLVGAKTITHEVIGKAASTKVQLMPARSGKGIVAGGPVRTIMQLGGVGNISAKIHGPKNKLNTIRATFNALNQLETKEQVMERKKDDIDWKRPTEKKRIGYLKFRGGGSYEHRASQFTNKREK